jgi:succinoglycan biosynthesis protein ExoA
MNEGAHIDRVLDAIDAQTYPADLIEILVVDGGSTDDTVDVVTRKANADHRVRLLGGPGVNTPLAMNIGIEAASGTLIAKVDGHGWMNPEFVEVAQRALAQDASIGCVGGVIDPIAQTVPEKAIALARFSRLGVGGGIYTAAKEIHFADTVQCGVYRRSALSDSGLFDPDLVYGEDEELNFRLRSSGWRILFHPGMRFSYHVRPTVGALLRQYFNYGRARVAVVRKHREFLKVKHVVPAAITGLLGVALVGLWPSSTRNASAVILAAYGATVGSGAVALSARHRFMRVDLVARSLMALHLGYGAGTMRGIGDLARESIRGK